MGSLGQGGTPGGATSKLLRAVSQAGSGQAQMERERNTPAILEAEKKRSRTVLGWNSAVWVCADAFCLPHRLPHSSALHLT